MERLLKVRLWKYWFAKKEEEFTPEQEKCIYWLFRKIFLIPNLSKTTLNYIKKHFLVTWKTDHKYFYKNIYWNIKKTDFIDFVIVLEDEAKKAREEKNKNKVISLEKAKNSLFNYCKYSYLWILLNLFDSWKFWKKELEIILNWESEIKEIIGETKQKTEEILVNE